MVSNINVKRVPTLVGVTLEADTIYFEKPNGSSVVKIAITNNDGTIVGYYVGMNITGSYSSGTTYARGDIVYDQTASWIALDNTTGNAPPTLPTTSNSYWQIIANGIAGADGQAFDHNGSGGPSSGLGSDGDTYLNIVNGDTYLKASGTWGLKGSIAGADGAPGPACAALLVFDSTQTTEVGDGAGNLFFRIPTSMNGMNLVGVAATVFTAGTTGTTDIQVHNITGGVDMLTTKITIDSGETDSSTAATPAVIDTTNDDVATGDVLRIDVDAVASTPAVGLLVTLEFEAP